MLQNDLASFGFIWPIKESQYLHEDAGYIRTYNNGKCHACIGRTSSVVQHPGHLADVEALVGRHDGPKRHLADRGANNKARADLIQYK